ncbi:MAG: DUF5606 domain-containing protein [Bacteroidota bacterium]|nr:DUF5606 domain-containing protein [Bacteroidota bacterium]
MIELKDVVAISGMPGLYHVIGQRKNGLIVEALDGSKKRFPTAPNTKVSILSDIAMFTMDGEEKLSNVLCKINEKEKGGLQIPGKISEDKAFTSFLASVLPNYDNERIYLSDMKKLANWYLILKDKIDFDTLNKTENDEVENKDEVKTESKAKAKVEKVVKNNTIKGDTKSKGKSVGTIRKMA